MLTRRAQLEGTRNGTVTPAFRRWRRATAKAERGWFKTNVRELKALGSTESLEVGYRQSPRGEAFLARTALLRRGTA